LQQTQYIAAWKSGVAVRWRGLTWVEFRQFTQQMAYSSPIEVYIDLYRAVLLDGPDVLSAPAGIVDYVGRTMLETNPFNGEYENIKHALDVKRSTQSYLDHARPGRRHLPLHVRGDRHLGRGHLLRSSGQS